MIICSTIILTIVAIIIGKSTCRKEETLLFGRYAYYGNQTVSVPNHRVAELWQLDLSSQPKFLKAALMPLRVSDFFQEAVTWIG